MNVTEANAVVDLFRAIERGDLDDDRTADATTFLALRASTALKCTVIAPVADRDRLL